MVTITFPLLWKLRNALHCNMAFALVAFELLAFERIPFALRSYRMTFCFGSRLFWPCMELSCSKLLHVVLVIVLTFPFQEMQLGFQTSANLKVLFTRKLMCLVCCICRMHKWRSRRWRSHWWRSRFALDLLYTTICTMQSVQSVHVCTICTSVHVILCCTLQKVFAAMMGSSVWTVGVCAVAFALEVPCTVCCAL